MNRTISLAAFTAVLCACAGTVIALDIKLADIVGGGNGISGGTVGLWINPATGDTTASPTFQISQPNNTNAYHVSPFLFIDGTFIPDGGAGNVTLDSLGHVYGAFPNTDSGSWDAIKYGPNQNSGNSLNGVNYNAGGHTMIGFHANKGMTFDLDEMEAAHPGLAATNFTAVAGQTHLTGGFGTADYWVFVDGSLVASHINTPGNVGDNISVALTPSNRFVTLVSTDHGDGFSLDQIMFGDPVVHLSSVPEPSALALGAMGALLLLIAVGRKGVSSQQFG